MPGAGLWERGYGITTGFSSTDSILAPIAIVAGGTLKRVRYSITFLSHQDVPFAELPPAQIVYGVTLLQGSPLPAPPDPIANPSADWLWHEGLGCKAIQHTVIAGTYTSLHAPISDEQRDARGQRKIVFDNPALCWVFTQEIKGSFTPLWNMQVTFSALFE